MSEEEQDTSATEDAQPLLISVTPEQMEQLHAAMLFFDQLRNSTPNAKANRRLNCSPPADPQVSPPADVYLPPSPPATPQPAILPSAIPPPASESPQSATPSSSGGRQEEGASHTAQAQLQASPPSSSQDALSSQSRKPSNTRYECDRAASGELIIRRYRKHPPPYDPGKDPRMICHTAVHKVCSRFLQVIGLDGEW